jgi:hypothetical protein
MNNTLSHTERELDILVKSSIDPDNRPIIEEFIPEIKALVEKFGNSGQSGGSAPYTAGALASAIKKICLQEPICPIMGIDEEWNENPDGFFQNNRCSALFKNGKDGTPYYLDAIVWKGDTEGGSGNDWDIFTGAVERITSRQSVKQFPFTPKTFYIDVTRVPFDKNIHSVNDAVSCGPGDFVYLIKDKKQLDEVFEYYNMFVNNQKL